jgi:hypothetical protein
MDTAESRAQLVDTVTEIVGHRSTEVVSFGLETGKVSNALGSNLCLQPRKPPEDRNVTVVLGIVDDSGTGHEVLLFGRLDGMERLDGKELSAA